MVEIDDHANQAKIIYLLKLAETSFYDIDRKYGLPRGTANHALRRPSEKAEQAIITELRVKLGRDNPDVHPFALWPRRYRDDGTRLNHPPRSAKRISNPRKDARSLSSARQSPNATVKKTTAELTGEGRS